MFLDEVSEIHPFVFIEFFEGIPFSISLFIIWGQFFVGLQLGF